MDSPEPYLDLDLDQRLRRAAPRDLHRVLMGYLAAALALLFGLPVLLGGWVASSQCSAEGFRCLGWFISVMLGAAVVAAIALPIIGWRLQVGWLFGLLAIAFIVAPLVLADGSPFGGAAFLGPGLAAWVSEPRTADPRTANPLAPPSQPASATRHWAPRLVAVLVLAVLLSLLGLAI